MSEDTMQRGRSQLLVLNRRRPPIIDSGVMPSSFTQSDPSPFFQAGTPLFTPGRSSPFTTSDPSPSLLSSKLISSNPSVDPSSFPPPSPFTSVGHPFFFSPSPYSPISPASFQPPPPAGFNSSTPPANSHFSPTVPHSSNDPLTPFFGPSTTPRPHPPALLSASRASGSLNVSDLLPRSSVGRDVLAGRTSQLGQTDGSPVPSLGTLSAFSSSSDPGQTYSSSSFNQSSHLNASQPEYTDWLQCVRPNHYEGLGGIDWCKKNNGACDWRTRMGLGKSTMLCKAIPPKDLIILNVLRADVELFLQHMEQQLCHRKELAWFTSKQIIHVQESLKGLKVQLIHVSKSVGGCHAYVNNLRHADKQSIRDVNLARNTRDTPLCLQVYNTEPDKFFSRLSDEFEESMVVYRAQVSETESHFKYDSMYGVPDLPRTLHDVVDVFELLRRRFVELAACLHLIHETVEMQRKVYITYCNTYHHALPSDLFRHSTQSSPASVHPSSPALPPRPRDKNVGPSVGPSPFSSVSEGAAVAMVSALGRMLASETARGDTKMPCLYATARGITKSPCLFRNKC